MGKKRHSWLRLPVISVWDKYLKESRRLKWNTHTVTHFWGSIYIRWKTFQGSEEGSCQSPGKEAISKPSHWSNISCISSGLPSNDRRKLKFAFSHLRCQELNSSRNYASGRGLRFPEKQSLSRRQHLLELPNPFRAETAIGILTFGGWKEGTRSEKQIYKISVHLYSQKRFKHTVTATPVVFSHVF